MSYITTVTGKHFDPMNPVDCEIDILDIAHALSLMCRGNVFGSGENRHLGAGRKHQFWFNRKSHYLNPFKSYILNSDQTTQ